MTKQNEIKCTNFLPAINNAVNNYEIDMEKTVSLLKGQDSMATVMWLRLDSDIKRLTTSKDSKQKALKDESDKNRKKVLEGEIADIEEQLGELTALFGGIDVLKQTGVFTMTNMGAIYAHGMKWCSYLYHEDAETIMGFVGDLNAYGKDHFDNLEALVAGKNAPKKFYGEVSNDIAMITTMLCPDANYKIKNKHIVAVLGKLVTRKTKGDKNGNAKGEYSYIKDTTLCQYICGLIAEKIANYDTDLHVWVKSEKK